MYKPTETHFYSLSDRIEEDLPIDRDLPGDEPQPNRPGTDQPGERVPNEEEPMPDRSRPDELKEDLPDATPDEPGRPNISEDETPK